MTLHRYAAACTYPPRCLRCGRDPLDEVHLVSLASLSEPVGICEECHSPMEEGRANNARFCRRPKCREKRHADNERVSIRAKRHRERVDAAMAQSMVRAV